VILIIRSVVIFWVLLYRIFQYSHYTECHNTEVSFSDCHDAEFSVVMLGASVDLLSFFILNANNTLSVTILSVIVRSVVRPSVVLPNVASPFELIANHTLRTKMLNNILKWKREDSKFEVKPNCYNFRVKRWNRLFHFVDDDWTRLFEKPKHVLKHFFLLQWGTDFFIFLFFLESCSVPPKGMGSIFQRPWSRSDLLIKLLWVLLIL